MGLPSIAQSNSGGAIDPIREEIDRRLQMAFGAGTLADRINLLNEINEYINDLPLPPGIDFSQERKAIEEALENANKEASELEEKNAGTEQTPSANETPKPVEEKPKGGGMQQEAPEEPDKGADKKKPQQRSKATNNKQATGANSREVSTNAQTSSQNIEAKLRRALGQLPAVPEPAPSKFTPEQLEAKRQNDEARRQEAALLTQRLAKEQQIAQLTAQINDIRTSIPGNIVTQRRAAYYKNKTQNEIAPLEAARLQLEQEIRNINDTLSPQNLPQSAPVAQPEPPAKNKEDELGPMYGPLTAEAAKFANLRNERRRADANRRSFAQVQAETARVSERLDFSIKDWLKDRQEAYKKTKTDAIYNVLSGAARKTGVSDWALPKLDAMDEALAQGGKTKLFKNISRSIYNSKPLGIIRLPAKKLANTRVGRWAGTKSRDASNWLRDKGSRFDNWLAGKILTDKFLDREVKVYGYEHRRRRRGSRLINMLNLREQYENEKKEKKHKLNSLFAVKYLYDHSIGRVLKNLKVIGTGVKDAARTWTGMKWLSNKKDILTTNLTNKFWASPIGRAAVGLQRLGNGLNALAKSIPTGLSTAATVGLVSFALTGGASIPLLIGAGLTGSTINIVTKTLTDTRPNSIAWIRGIQERFGALNWNMLQEGGKAGMSEAMMLDGINPIRVRSNMVSLLKSYNWGISGLALGTLAGLLIPGLSPIVGGIIGGGLGLGSKFAIDRFAVRMSLRAGQSPMIQAFSKMPFFETLGLVQAIPWINSQLHGIRSWLGHMTGLGGSDAYWKYFLNSWNPLKSPLTAFGNIANLGLNIHNGFKLWSWGSKAITSGAGAGGGTLLAYTLGGGAVGAVLGGIIAVSVGLPIGAGFLVGGGIGMVVGGVFGSFIAPGIGTFIGSLIGTTVGSLFGSVIDKITGRIVDTSKALEALFGALSLVKGIIDFLKALSEKFDPTNAVGLAFTLIFSIGLLNEMVKNMSYTDQSQESSAQGIYAEKDPTTGKVDTTKPNTQNIKPQIIDCLTQENMTIVNPKTATVTNITIKKGKYYQISTKYYEFINIINPSAGIDVNSTINKGRVLGDCLET